MRGVGLTEWLVDLVPESLVPLLLVLTHLGDPAVLVGLAAVVYWLGPRYGVIARANGARLLAVTLGSLALVVLLKHGFALPRPPTATRFYPQSSFGFPSGHATGSAAVYGALAALAHWRTRATRYVLAAGLILGVALTRLLLGVHYLGDVVAGMGVGLLLAWLVIVASRNGIRHGFRIAALVAVAAAVVAWPDFDAATAIGGSVGALASWELRGGALLDAPDVSLALATAGFVVFGGLAGATYVLEPASPVVVVVYAVTGAGFVGLPLVQNFSR